MGDRTASRETYRKAVATVTEKSKGAPATKKAEQKVRETGELNPLVDPKGYGVIRESRPRFKKKDGFWLLTVGTPMPIETRVDTTGSMGDNVDIALRVLPNSVEPLTAALPGYDLHVALGIFGDVQDPIVLCRPQFEMEAEKIVAQLTMMVPCRDGGDTPEDPHYGLFGAAYLTRAYINLIGLKRYDFTVTDAPARDRLDESQLVRIFGSEVFEKTAANGCSINRHALPSTGEVVQDLLRGAHAFLLQVGDESSAHRFWTKIYGRERIVMLPCTQFLPQVQAAIIGLTEGTLDLQSTTEFLISHNVSARDADAIARSVSGIPIGAQAALPNFSKRPQKGDLFETKTSLWPLTKEELAARRGNAEGGTSEEKKDKTEWA